MNIYTLYRQRCLISIYYPHTLYFGNVYNLYTVKTVYLRKVWTICIVHTIYLAKYKNILCILEDVYDRNTLYIVYLEDCVQSVAMIHNVS